ncbi:hypothetical protein AZF01_05120 [Martelella sp. AD-3]|uniref:hypothetical protein n=1 Tax=Martelella sp. AD-3 TaxID=686597 RepID=UPI000777698F|nr:hypothetical protein [Martelella sp. AD-3]AMM83814.1 hypothetical protein AZF01_05120 [Martelella sp. AD-3]
MKREVLKPLRSIGTILIAAALVAATPFVVPNGMDAVRLLAAHDDPVAITDYRLDRLAPSEYEVAILEALADDDPDLAGSVLALADSRGVPIDGALRDRTEVAVFNENSLGNRLSDMFEGALTGRPDSAAGLIGAVATDLTTVGDVRDIIIEGGAYLSGEDYDPFILGISVAGIAITGAVILSAGSATTAKVGTSALKAAGKAGALTAPLRRSFTRLSRQAVNAPALRTAVPLLKRGNVPAASRALSASLNAKPLLRMQDAAANVGTVMTKQGLRAGTDMLKVADTPADLTKFGKLSARVGKRFRAVVFLLGSGAVTLSGLLLTAAGWTTSFAVWLAGAAYFGFRLFRLSWRIALLPFGRLLVRLMA